MIVADFSSLQVVYGPIRPREERRSAMWLGVLDKPMRYRKIGAQGLAMHEMRV